MLRHQFTNLGSPYRRVEHYDKTRITIRIDDDLLAWFKDQVDAAGGGNYQSLINAALREHANRKKEPLEATLRRVLREELRATT